MYRAPGEVMPLADVTDWLTAAPLAFVVGVVVGLVLCGRGYRIVRRPPD